MTRHCAIFLDKDGTLLDDVPFNVDPSLMRLAPGAREALQLLGKLPYRLFVVSNQAGVALGKFQWGALDAVHAQLQRMFVECGAYLSGAYWCPHHPHGSVARYSIECDCRKPAPGLLLSAASQHRLDLARSWFVGDILDDVEAGNRAGCRTVLLDNGHETEWLTGAHRVPTLRAPDLGQAVRAIMAEPEREPEPAADARITPPHESASQ